LIQVQSASMSLTTRKTWEEFIMSHGIPQGHYITYLLIYLSRFHLFNLAVDQYILG